MPDVVSCCGPAHVGARSLVGLYCSGWNSVRSIPGHQDAAPARCKHGKKSALHRLVRSFPGSPWAGFSPWVWLSALFSAAPSGCTVALVAASCSPWDWDLEPCSFVVRQGSGPAAPVSFRLPLPSGRGSFTRGMCGAPVRQACLNKWDLPGMPAGEAPLAGSFSLRTPYTTASALV